MVSLEELYNRLYMKFPEEKENIEVINYKNLTSKGTFKCKKCGTIFESQPKSVLIRHTSIFCNNCRNPLMEREKTKNSLADIENIFNTTPDITKIWVGFKKRDSGTDHSKLAIQFLCNKCHRENTVFYQDINKKQLICKYCKKDARQTVEMFNDWLIKNYDGKFIMLDYSEYQNHTSRIHIKCNDCGFIFYPTVTSLKRDKKVLCPKCKHGKSRAEIYIGDWLTKHQINYKSEEHPKWLSKPYLRYDFIVEDYKIVIEFMGAQHYTFIPHFHSSKERFEELKNNDILKEKECKQNGYNYLAIPYRYESKLNRILTNLFGSTTIPEGSRGKSLEIDSIYSLDEDIV